MEENKEQEKKYEESPEVSNENSFHGEGQGFDNNTPPQNEVKRSQKWAIGGVIVIAVFVMSAAFILYTLNQTEDEAEVVQTESEDEENEDVIEFGLLPLHIPSKMSDRFGALENYINENTDIEVKMKYYPTEGELGGYSAAVQDFIDGEIGFVYLAPVTTIQAYGNIGDEMEVLVCGERYDGSATYQGDLIVREDSPYQSVKDLEGKPVAGTSISSTSGNLMPSAMLIEEGIDPETFFVSVDEDKEGGLSYLGSHDKAVEALLSGLVDGAFVNEQTMYKFMEDGAEIRSIWRHDPVPEFPISANKNVVSEEEIDQFYKAVLENEDIEPKVYERIDADYNRFVDVSIEDYLPVKNAIDRVHGEVFYDLEEWGKDPEDREE
ncbi:MAG: phosphate/phosphite/phosphonate ABC transporter substrate-binding protein, partial [Patescibacteria group bacterium]